MSSDSVLVSAIAAFGASSGPEERAALILRTSMEFIGASRGVIYFLDTQAGMLVPEIAAGFDHPPDPLVADQVVAPVGCIGLVADLRRATEGNGAPGPTGVAIYASRSEACIAIMQLEGDLPSDLIPTSPDLARTLAPLLLMLYEQRFVGRLLSVMGRPVAFDSPDEKVPVSMLESAATATGAAYVLARKLVADELRCVAAVGFEDDVEIDRWDLSRVDGHGQPLLTRVLEGDTVLVSAEDAPFSPESANNRFLRPKDSIAILPVFLEGEFWGTLSFGFRTAASPTREELDGLIGVARLFGLAFAAKSGLDAMNEQLRAQSSFAALATEVELSRSARHEIKNLLGNCQVGLRNLHRRLRDTPFAATIDDISNQLVKVDNVFGSRSLARMSKERQDMSLKQIWNQALKALGSQLEEQSVVVHYAGPDITASMSPEYMLHALLNLLLNSLDAFRGTGRRRRRSIDLRVPEPAAKARDLSVVYSDTAGGIDPSTLAVPESCRGLPLEQLIFEPGVTSKSDGTGFGLWLVRQILNQHHGSIDLLSHRGGVSFAIQLPRSAQ